MVVVFIHNKLWRPLTANGLFVNGHNKQSRRHSADITLSWESSSVVAAAAAARTQQTMAASACE